MRYAGLNKNDVVNGEGISVSLFMQGCPIHCPGCHNPESWDFNGGMEIEEDDLVSEILAAMQKNGIQRNFSLLGGEPLCPENADFAELITWWVKSKYPESKIYIWTGYTIDQLRNRANDKINKILSRADVLITGPFVLEERDISLPLRGSKNQKILKRGVDF